MANEFIARNGMISKGNVVVTGSLTTSGSLTTTGTITATTLVVQTITSSISSITGSTNFGTLSSNTHTFTGSINASGSATFSGSVTSNGVLIAGLANGNVRLKGSTDGFLGVGESNGLLYLADWDTTAKGIVINLSNGSVGIGTSSPNTKLQVEDGFISTYHNINADGAGYGIQFFTNGGGSKNTLGSIDISQIGTARSGNMLFNTSNAGAPSTKMIITSAGNVGIGTSNPFSDTNFVSTYIGGTSGGQLILGASAGGSANRYLLLQGDNNAGSILAIGSRPLDFYTNGTLRMTITSGSNVGIGTSSPQRLLDARGTVNLGTTTPTVGTTSGAYADVHLRTFSGYPSAQAKIVVVDYWTDFYSTYTDGFRFFNYDGAGTTPVERMRISGAGYITKPNNPAFRAYRLPNNDWSLTNGSTFVFTTTEYNIGGCYDTSNGRFTAPVAGVYQFNFYSILLGAYTNAAVGFRRNGSQPPGGSNIHFSPTNGSGTWSNVVYTTSIYLNASDYINFINTSGATVTFHGGDWSSFSGYLVG